MNVVLHMLDEPDFDVETVPSVADLPGDRLARLVARLPGLRMTPNLGGHPPLITIDADEATDGAMPVWLAVAEPAQQLAALQDGAAGVVPRNVDRDALAAAVDAIRLGFAVLPPALLRTMLAVGNGEPSVARRDGPSLTPREDAVLSLLSEGATNKMIARRLDISVHTAKFHVASILDKLDATTRTDAVAQGVRQGLLML